MPKEHFLSQKNQTIGVNHIHSQFEGLPNKIKDPTGSSGMDGWNKDFQKKALNNNGSFPWRPPTGNQVIRS